MTTLQFIAIIKGICGMIHPPQLVASTLESRCRKMVASLIQEREHNFCFSVPERLESERVLLEPFVVGLLHSSTGGLSFAN